MIFLHINLFSSTFFQMFLRGLVVRGSDSRPVNLLRDFSVFASEAACGLTSVVQMNFTVTDGTQMTVVYSNSRHWNLMQTPRRFKYVVRFLGEPVQALSTSVQGRGWRSPAGLLVLHLLKALCCWVWTSPCKSCYLAPAQEIWASAFSMLTIYGHMLYILCHVPNPSLLCCTTS